jgi:hypothetical protein
VLAKLRGLDSNQRPPGYEPDELPLLYPAIVARLYHLDQGASSTLAHA